MTLHGHQQMINNKIRLIILFAPKMEKLYIVRKKKKDQELTVAQIMNSLQISDIN